MCYLSCEKLGAQDSFFWSSQGQEVEIKKKSTGPWFFVSPKGINKLEAFLHGQVLVQVYGTWLQKLALHVEANILGHTMMMSKMKAPMLKVVDSTLADPDFLRSKTNNQIQWTKPESDPLLGFSSYDILLNLMDQNSKGFDFMQVLIVSKGFKGFAFSEQTEESLSRFFGQTKGQVSHRWGTMSIVSKLIAATEDGVIDDRERQDLQVLLHHVFFFAFLPNVARISLAMICIFYAISLETPGIPRRSRSFLWFVVSKFSGRNGRHAQIGGSIATTGLGFICSQIFPSSLDVQNCWKLRWIFVKQISLYSVVTDLMLLATSWRCT